MNFLSRRVCRVALSARNGTQRAWLSTSPATSNAGAVAGTEASERELVASSQPFLDPEFRKHGIPQYANPEKHIHPWKRMKVAPVATFYKEAFWGSVLGIILGYYFHAEHMRLKDNRETWYDEYYHFLRTGEGSDEMKATVKGMRKRHGGLSWSDIKSEDQYMMMSSPNEALKSPAEIDELCEIWNLDKEKVQAWVEEQRAEFSLDEDNWPTERPKLPNLYPKVEAA